MIDQKENDELIDMMLTEWFNMDNEPCEPRCQDEYCGPCATMDCPRKDPLHRHHDGCPSCTR